MMLKIPKLLFVMTLFATSFTAADAEDFTIKISKRYLNFPISEQEKMKTMSMKVKDSPERKFVIQLASGKPDYWVFSDVSEWRGKTLEISYSGDEKDLKNIIQDNKIIGQDSLYKECNRPRFHFTTRRGWNNDPNGLVYYKGEYHLFYQHNPYNRNWGNMHWAHAVSKDLVHWKELQPALYPDELGTMFSGSAAIDYDNTAGCSPKGRPAMIAMYTADSPQKETQCMAYSLDKGRTFTKYEGNPVVDSKERWNDRNTRDPKIFWYAPGKHWVMVLFERSGHSIYNSTDLKNWEYKSHINGFYECPELFELPVDGNKNNTRWVIYDASGDYMTGSFDGKTFTPESEKLKYFSGMMYAAQTYNNIPEKDGRRIQIGWGRVRHAGMPFNSMMTLPTELTLHSTPQGIRMFSTPVEEIKKIFKNETGWKSVTPETANKNMLAFSDKKEMRIKTTLKPAPSGSAVLKLCGQEILNYDISNHTLNGVPYLQDTPKDTDLTADIYIDRTSVEIFVDEGRYSFYLRKTPETGNREGFTFNGNNLEIKDLQVYSVKSIW